MNPNENLRDDEFDKAISQHIISKREAQKDINKKNREYLRSISTIIQDDNGKDILLVPEGVSIGKGNSSYNMDYNSTHIISNVSNNTPIN